MQLPAPARGPLDAVVDPGRDRLLVYQRGLPVKAYSLRGSMAVQVGPHRLKLRPRDAVELAGRLDAARLRVLRSGQSVPGGDRDGDGLPDLLDLVMGAHKAALNGAAYGAGYIRIAYPGGDVPRDVGVCTDVVIRAARNAGVDLQREVYEDIGRARRSYPMVKKRNRHIDHRRVRTILPYFKRHWKRLSTRLDDPSEPLLPGDVVFMDTMPNRNGPDHIGIISTRHGDSGHPLVINNWTNGYHTSEMDLLTFVPVTHRFRLQP